MTKTNDGKKPFTKKKLEVVGDTMMITTKAFKIANKIKNAENVSEVVKREVWGWYELAAADVRSSTPDKTLPQLKEYANEAAWCYQMVKAGSQWAPRSALE